MGRIVTKLYKDGELIYQRRIFSTRLSVSTNSLSFPKTGNTQNVTVKSNIPYTYASDVDWLTISTASTGIAVTANEYTGSTQRTGTITITASNAGDVVTKTISVIQKAVHYVSYIHTATIGSQSTNAKLIDTGIYPTTATTFRVIGQSKGYTNGDIVVGYSANQSLSDDKDYRIFWATSNNLYFDWNSSRLQKQSWTGTTTGSIIDLTCSNYQITDNTTGTILITGTPQTSMALTTIPIYVDCGTWWLKKLQIWDGQTLVFDGEAAIDDGHIGLYDNVSGELKYNPELNMGYEV